MTQPRPDMSDWVIHFVHDRDPDKLPFINDEHGNGQLIPFHADPSKAGRFDLWGIKDVERPLDTNARALSVLLRILDDGHIRAGWSMRNGRPTIYGPRPACCFTEMPVYALLEYAKSRAKADSVNDYGIALLKSELFAAGGRPVIYSLSSIHLEQHNVKTWPRILDRQCGIAEWEQYRYVAMSLGQDRWIDWSHEREWRWADMHDCVECPGFPIWYDDESNHLTRAIVIVRTDAEAQRILDKLRELMDAGCDEYTNPYNCRMLERTRILVPDDVLANGNRTSTTLKLDDIPLRELVISEPVVPDGPTIERVRLAIAKAKVAATQTALGWTNLNDVYGYAYLMVDDPHSAVVQALLKLEELDATGSIGCRFRNIGGCGDSGMLCQAECAVEAAMKVLECELPEAKFSLRTVWD